MIGHKDFSNYVECKKATLVKAGDEFVATLFKMIDQAKFNIHFHTYIFYYDEVGKKVLERLIAAHQRGVSVYLMIDGFGSFNFPAKVMEEMQQMGIHARFFGHWIRGGRIHLGRRLHSKVVVVDSFRCLVGGINIGEPFLAGEKVWLDYALYVQGSIGAQLHRYCSAIFDKKHHLAKFHQSLVPVLQPSDAILVRTSINDFMWFLKRDIEFNFRHEISKAKSEVLLLQSYFLPWPSFYFSLKRAVKRGVRVILVLPKISDVPLFHLATQFYYEKLLKAGIEIWEWPSTVLHAKLALIDGHWMSIGSFNINFTSRYGNVEVNLDILNATFVAETRRYLETGIFPLCQKIECRDTQKGVWYKTKLLFAYFTVIFSEIFSKFLIKGDRE